MVERRLAQIREPADGPSGEPGPRGEPGAPGKIERLHGYIEGAVHYRGDIVAHRGCMYQAQCDTARAPQHEDWACLATAGRDGIDGRSVRVRGTYRASDDYAALDVVALNGGSFIARRDDPGECPGEGWQSPAQAPRLWAQAARPSASHAFLSDGPPGVAQRWLRGPSVLPGYGRQGTQRIRRLALAC
jgi:hypothetical protein